MAWSFDVLTKAERDAILEADIKSVETAFFRARLRKRRIAVKVGLSEQDRTTQTAKVNAEMATLEAEKAELIAARGNTNPS